jgi:hypothetical protein
MKIETVRRLNHIKALPVIGKEGQLGELRDAFFDLDAWVIRYLVMVARSNGREVLLSPLLFGDLDDSTDRLILSLFDEEIEAIPPLDLGRPVSREQELAYDLYFCIPDYWVDGRPSRTRRAGPKIRPSHACCGGASCTSCRPAARMYGRAGRSICCSTPRPWRSATLCSSCPRRRCTPRRSSSCRSL